MGRTSRGHPGVIRADIPTQNFGQGAQNPGKNKHLGADIHDPKARTSTTLRDSQKLRSEKLWAEFSFPINLRARAPKVVAQCSATPATVPATPPCSATPFQTQISVRHLPGMGGGKVRHQIFRGCGATPAKRYKSRKSAATRNQLRQV